MSRRTPARLAAAEPNLVRQERALNKRSVQDLLRAALQKLADARRVQNSGPTRVECAYDTILFCALAIFATRGYRVVSDRGHHSIALEGLAAELGLSQGRVDEIELLLDLRNTKYSGFASVGNEDVSVALDNAQRVIDETEAWMSTHAAWVLKPGG